MTIRTDIQKEGSIGRSIPRGMSAVPTRYLVLVIATMAFVFGGCTEMPSSDDIVSEAEAIVDRPNEPESSRDGRSDGTERQNDESREGPDDEVEFDPDLPIDEEPDRPFEDQPEEEWPEDERPEEEQPENERPEEEWPEDEEPEEESRGEDRPDEDKTDGSERDGAQPPQGGVLNILPLGDSITEGVPFTYRHSLHNTLIQQNYAFDFVGSHRNGADGYPDNGWDRDNEGWSGWTTESVQSELADWSSSYTVDIALIHLGTNDAGGDDVDASAAAMTSIIQQLRRNNGSVSICMAQILPFGWIPQERGEPGSAELNAFVERWNERLRTLALNMTTPESPIVLVDMNSDFSEADLDDGVHPTREGAKKMADKWLECISSF